MAFIYLMHGLTLSLPFLCEEIGTPVATRPPQIAIVEGDVPLRLDEATLREAMYDLAWNRALFRGPERCARFLVEDGCKITYYKGPACQEGQFRHRLLYPIMAQALWQRGVFALHASSVISPQGVVLLTGESGAGKSTSAARLIAEGWPLQADDLSALNLDPSGDLTIMPGAQFVHLDEAAGQRLGLNIEGLERRAFQRMKMAVPVPEAGVRCGKAIAMIVYLHHAQTLSVKPVIGREKLSLLLNNLYPPVLAERVSHGHDLLSRAIQQIDMIAIGRPPGVWSMEDVVRAIRHA